MMGRVWGVERVWGVGRVSARSCQLLFTLGLQSQALRRRSSAAFPPVHAQRQCTPHCLSHLCTSTPLHLHTRSWENGDELGDTWASRNAYSYGRGGERGRARPEVLQSLLGTCDRVVQVWRVWGYGAWAGVNWATRTAGGSAEPAGHVQPRCAGVAGVGVWGVGGCGRGNSHGRRFCRACWARAAACELRPPGFDVRNPKP
eukprot:365691-Chlamydomonas_euryale.AAC.6